jgi:hypothetical protein
MTGSVNAYISAKRVSRAPNDALLIAGGEVNGVTWTAALDKGDHPAFLLKMSPKPQRSPEALLLRLDLVRLVASLIGAEAAETGAWEPLKQDEGQPQLWFNSWVTASVEMRDRKNGGRLAHITYHRNDRAPIRDWRVGQKIKNQLCGPEWEGVELYPAESRVVDTCNEYHLWATDGPVPFGFEEGERSTQAQLDEVWGSPDGGPVQTDDPDADTSSFDTSPDRVFAAARNPDGPDR